MNILVVYPYIPYPLDRGTYQRTFHLLKGLSEHHTVDFIALCESGKRTESRSVFEEFCREVSLVPFTHPSWEKLLPARLFRTLPSTIQHWKSEELAGTIRKQLKRHKYDAVHVCDIVLAQYFLREHRDIQLIVDRSRVDLQFQLQQTQISISSFKNKLLAFENIAKLWWYEKRVARRTHRQIVCGPDDAVFIRNHIKRNASTTVIPNGVDIDYFYPDPSKGCDESPTIMFCGAMDYTPNSDAIHWYFNTIHQRIQKTIPKLKVFIVGRGGGPSIEKYGKLPGVTVTGSVQDVRPYYRRSWLQIVPLRIGGGTRLKIVESLSIGTPVVSTTIGAQGLDLVHGENILLADSDTEFSQCVIDALSSNLLRKRLLEKGIKEAEKRFSWSFISRKLITAYNPGNDASCERVSLLELPFDRISMKGALVRISEMVEARTPCQIATANVDFVLQSRRDSELKKSIEQAKLVLCDGAPLVWLSRWLQKSLPERVAGSDLAPHLLELAERKGWSIYFLGGSREVLRDAIGNVRERYPRLSIAGFHSPPHAPLEEMDHEGIVRRIKKTKPDLLLVSLGCPKQEKWLARHLEKTEVPVGIGLGATVDFLAGHMKRAPLWMRQSGLEWVFRLAQEPRRLVHRYAADFSFFFSAVVETLFKKPDHI